MHRPIGIFVAGVILLISGLLGIFTFSLGVLGTMSIPSAQMPAMPAVRDVEYVAEGIFAVISAFYCWVAIDLFRMRSWARYATIVLAALGACFCGFSAVMMMLLRHMPLPSPSLPPRLLHELFVGLAIFYFVLAAISLFWVIYFNRASVRTAFMQAAAHRKGEDAYSGVILPNRRQHEVIGLAQVIVWVVAVLFLLGGASMIVLMLLGMPMFLFGWVATGAAAFLIEILCACLMVYAGIGLIFHWRGGWLLAVILQLYSLLSVILLLVPGYPARLFAASQMLTARLAPGAAVAPANPAFLVASSAVGGLVALGILVALVRCRQSYLS